MLERIYRLIAEIFFREIVIEGREHLPSNGPVIFTSNHPNDLLDPLILRYLSPPFRLRFIAKSTLFDEKVVGWLLRRERAIPVIRHQDVNGDIDYGPFFEACLEALREGDSLVVFPEGRSIPVPAILPLRTGTARLFFLARERGISVKIVPVGLNYEKGDMFRSSVLLSVAPPVDAEAFAGAHLRDPSAAIRGLTAEIQRAMEDHVFQAESYAERELMVLLERLYHEGSEDDSWPDRYARLKAFESRISPLRERDPQKLKRLKRLLARYRSMSCRFGVRETGRRTRGNPSLKAALLGAVGMIFAGVGFLLNWFPYRACAALIRHLRINESDAGTQKVFFSLALYPATYAAEGLVILKGLGWPAALLFWALVAPLSYFTLRYFEWRDELGLAPVDPSAWFAGRVAPRSARSLARLRRKIVSEVDALSSGPST